MKRMKHVNTFEGFLTEKYQTYSDFDKKGSRWGSPQDLRDDVSIAVKHLLPVEWGKAPQYIKSIEDQSDDQMGIKFQVTLTSGDIIHGYKVGPLRSQWEWYLNKKKKKNQDIYQELETTMYSPYERWERQYNMFDSTYQYSDDPRAYREGSAHDKFVKSLYDKLSTADKKKADKYIASK
jgi:hypothetical protein